MLDEIIAGGFYLFIVALCVVWAWCVFVAELKIVRLVAPKYTTAAERFGVDRKQDMPGRWIKALWRNKPDGRLSICCVKVGKEGVLVRMHSERWLRSPRLLIPSEALGKLQPVELPWYLWTMYSWEEKYVEAQIIGTPMSIILDNSRGILNATVTAQ